MLEMAEARSGVVDGPTSLQEGDSPDYAWPNTSKLDGVFYQRSGIRNGMISDGHSNTYLLGEKYVSKSGYSQFGDFGYDQPYIAGDDWDTIRWTEKPPRVDGPLNEPEIFGAHTLTDLVLHFAMARFALSTTPSIWQSIETWEAETMERPIPRYPKPDLIASQTSKQEARWTLSLTFLRTHS